MILRHTHVLWWTQTAARDPAVMGTNRSDDGWRYHRSALRDLLQNGGVNTYFHVSVPFKLFKKSAIQHSIDTQISYPTGVPLWNPPFNAGAEVIGPQSVEPPSKIWAAVIGHHPSSCHFYGRKMSKMTRLWNCQAIDSRNWTRMRWLEMEPWKTSNSTD